MAYREILESDLEGKSIESVDLHSTNVLTLHFTDGTEAELWADTEYLFGGNVPCFRIDDHKEKGEDDGS